jgi:hypothetical protein
LETSEKLELGTYGVFCIKMLAFWVVSSDNVCMGRYGKMFDKAVKRLGAPRRYETAEALAADISEYFRDIEDDSLEEEVLFHSNGVVTKEKKKLPRAMTLGTLWLHLGIDRTTWADWRNNRPDLATVITQTEQAIREQKFEGAAAGLFNPNIIARDIGLREMTSTELTGRDGGPIEIAASDKLKAYIDGIAERSRAASITDE